MKKLLLFILTLFCIVSHGQQGVPFKINKQFYIKGASELIGNNILSVHKNKPYNQKTITNDLLELKYIDIDNNKTTFSSSEANLSNHSKDRNIKYAGLYWSAIYKYEKGFKKIEDERFYVYKGNDKRDPTINEILFKTPNDSKYKAVKGQVIYDSYISEEFEDTKPYVCFADVTHLLKNNKSINGTYTVGNIKATQGFISGGCAGGWLLYVVYESEEETPKYFTTYNGFESVNKQTIDIDFQSFKTTEAGDIKTSLCLGTLEGDQKLKTDMCLIFNPTSKTYIPLYNKERPAKNFFNSKITSYDTLYTDRNPNSSNTLGFDVLKINIPNKNNTTIANNQTGTTIRLKTKADGFNMFFVAFETEISPIFYESKTNTETILVVENTNNKLEENIAENTHVETKDITTLDNSVLEKMNKIKSSSIPNLKRGYYLITNMFSVKKMP